MCVRLTVLPRFYRDEREFARVHARLKVLPCPECSRRGTLILNGMACGYCAGSSSRRHIRGHRVLCSRRRRAPKGCGKSFVLLCCSFLPRLQYRASTLWTFLRGLAEGRRVVDAFSLTGLYRSLRTVYRLLGRVRRSLPSIRTLLVRYWGPPPSAAVAGDEITQTFSHIHASAEPPACPLAQLQQRSGHPLLV